jgi:3-hydroxyacyl-[acyl-carrier-protein] dehydratase
VFYFVGIDGARFKRPVEPGDQLILHTAMDRARAGIYKFNVKATVDDEVACEAVLMCTRRQVS